MCGLPISLESLFMTEVTSQPGIFELFGLDGKLFFAQLINFANIILIVAKWVYKPLLAAIDARDHKIQKGLKDAEAAKMERETTAVETRTKHEAAEAEARAIIEAARAEALKERVRLTLETQSDLDRKQREAEARLQEAKQAMIDDVKKDMTDLILGATKKVASTVLNETSHRTLIQQAIKEVEEGI